MNAKLVSIFQHEATVRLNAAERKFVNRLKTCQGKVIDFDDMAHLRALRECADKARSRHLRWTRYRLQVESGVN